MIHILITLTDAEAEALAFAHVTPESFVQTTRERWAWEKRSAAEMLSAHLLMHPTQDVANNDYVERRAANLETWRSWGLKS